MNKVEEIKMRRGKVFQKSVSIIHYLNVFNGKSLIYNLSWPIISRASISQKIKSKRKTYGIKMLFVLSKCHSILFYTHLKINIFSICFRLYCFFFLV